MIRNIIIPFLVPLGTKNGILYFSDKMRIDIKYVL
jgi:hypothetical protein